VFKEHETFILCRPLADTTIPVNTCGVILMVLGGQPCSYEVEFPDGQGGNLGKEVTYTVTEDFLRRH